MNEEGAALLSSVAACSISNAQCPAQSVKLGRRPEWPIMASRLQSSWPITRTGSILHYLGKQKIAITESYLSMVSQKADCGDSCNISFTVELFSYVHSSPNAWPAGRAAISSRTGSRVACSRQVLATCPRFWTVAAQEVWS